MRKVYTEGKEEGVSSGKGSREQAMRLMEALSGVDEELLIRAAGEESYSELPGEEDLHRRADGTEEAAGTGNDGTGRKSRRSRRTGQGSAYRTIWRQARPWAAVLCLAVVGVLGWGGYQLTDKVDENMSGGAMNDAAMPAEGCAPDSAEEECAPMEGGAADTAGPAAGAEERAGNMYADQKGQNDAAGNSNGNGADAGAGSAEDMRDHLGSVGNQPDYSLPGFPDESRWEFSKESASGSGAGAVQESAAGGSGEEEAAKEESAATDSAAGEGVTDSAGCLAVRVQKMTEEEARGQESLGQFLPEKVSRGYLFEQAFRNLDREEANLSIVWSRGMDFIQWSVVQEASAPETVDADRPESYDVRLYEIPWADSVPEEYRQSIDNPVFDSGDLTLEIVRSRMAVYEDQGDTDTPRGRFGVLYPDNYVVYFNGRGTAEEVWEMFSSIEGGR